MGQQFNEVTIAKLLHEKKYDELTRLTGTATSFPPDTTNTTAQELEQILARNPGYVKTDGATVTMDWRLYSQFYSTNYRPNENIMEALVYVGLLTNESNGNFGVFDEDQNLGPQRWGNPADVLFFVRKKDAKEYAQSVYNDRIGGGVYVAKISDIWKLKSTE